MAKKKKGGFINRLIMGSEKSETYARSTLPSNRWGLFWDILKTRFSKLLIINLLMLLFLIPLFLLLIMRGSYLSATASTLPFSQNIGLGYPAIPLMQGYEELISLQTNQTIYMFLPIISFIVSIGIAGGFYIIRNIVWTEGIFVSNDFWRGIKLNYVQVMLTAFIYSLFVWLSQYTMSFCNYMLAVGSKGAFWLRASIVCNYILMGLLTIMVLYMLSISVTYKCSFFQLIKNAFLLTIGLLPQNLFFAFLGALPILIYMLGGIFGMIGLLIFIFFGPVLLILVWTDYSQWVFDKFINDKVEGAKKNRGIYDKVGKTDSKSLQQYKEQMEKFSNSTLSSRPIKPITDDIEIVELPTTFNRADLQRLQESKQVMIEDNLKYIEEHLNDDKYQNVPKEETPEEEDIDNMSADYLKTRKGKKQLKEMRKQEKNKKVQEDEELEEEELPQEETNE